MISELGEDKKLHCITVDVLDSLPEPDGLTIISTSSNSGHCGNKCVFCYIDQNPKLVLKPRGRAMTVKRDALNDIKLEQKIKLAKKLGAKIVRVTDTSGNVKLDKTRITSLAKVGLDQIQISVHTTNPKTRVKLLQNPNAGKLIELLSEFSACEIELIADLVLVPNYNAKEIGQTLMDLNEAEAKEARLFPVGVTKLQRKIRALTRNELLMIKEKVQDLNLNLEVKFSPALQAMIGEDLFPEFKPFSVRPKIPTYIITGELSAHSLERVFPTVKVVPVKNSVFGESIGSTGLLTAKDLLRCAKSLNGTPSIKAMILPSAMFDTEGYTLDGIHLNELTRKLLINYGFIVQVPEKLAQIKNMLERI